MLSLWAGQGLRLARQGKAADIVDRLGREAEDVIRQLADRLTPKS
jgi:NAD(P)H-dependent flavin oxidoreductase YrpB (nitropropane dioxygenase family)